MRKEILGASAILVVGLIAVSTSTPALAVESAASGTAPGASQEFAVGRGAQSMVVSDATVTADIERDGFSVTAPAPAPAPAPVVAAAAPTAAVPVASGWVLPVSGTISDSFGARPDLPVAGVNSFHSGTDISAPTGTQVVAASAGTVVFAGENGTYGEWVLIDHGNGIQTGYAHNSSILVSVGQSVAAGETISLVGSTGAATGPHLHFEVRVNDEAIDAIPFMSERGITLG
ncbi:hypothetical protein GCM10022381_18140 [Leifsonia kafniensis]|uniref:M23ase beta-sheet core domain-containing protein n=1 Tax=Leifsonia kafniensis TaxID=475957 RepID=A0ABP7KHF8_9MICO